jgi:hypothetical protein
MVLIRDGMGIIQSLDVKKFSNFGDLAIFYLKHLSMLFQSKFPAKYKVCPTGKGLSALTNFEINSPIKLINSCLFLLVGETLW